MGSTRLARSMRAMQGFQVGVGGLAMDVEVSDEGGWVLGLRSLDSQDAAVAASRQHHQKGFSLTGLVGPALLRLSGKDPASPWPPLCDVFARKAQ
jgi:hypothetical protein